jgi:hypothetical protein
MYVLSLLGEKRQKGVIEDAQIFLHASMFDAIFCLCVRVGALSAASAAKVVDNSSLVAAVCVCVCAKNFICNWLVSGSAVLKVPTTPKLPAVALIN